MPAEAPAVMAPVVIEERNGDVMSVVHEEVRVFETSKALTLEQFGQEAANDRFVFLLLHKPTQRVVAATTGAERDRLVIEFRKSIEDDANAFSQLDYLILPHTKYYQQAMSK